MFHWQINETRYDRIGKAWNKSENVEMAYGIQTLIYYITVLYNIYIVIYYVLY